MASREKSLEEPVPSIWASWLSFPNPSLQGEFLFPCSHIEEKGNFWLPPTKHLYILALNHEPAILVWGPWLSLVEISYPLLSQSPCSSYCYELREPSLALNLLYHHFIKMLTVTAQVWPGFSTLPRISFFPSRMLFPALHFYSFSHLFLN